MGVENTLKGEKNGVTVRCSRQSDILPIDIEK